MRLADLIDLEARIAADEGADPEDLRARDRAIHARLAPVPAGRDALLSAWVEALRAPGERLLGERLVGGYRLVTAALVLAGLAAGWGVASWAFSYDGRQPVNIANALWALVLTQVLLLVVLLVGAPLASRFPDLPLIGDLRALLRAGAERVMPASWATARHRLRTRGSLYRGIETWLLLRTTQAFGLAFNVAALACCLRLVVFTDLTFGWSTTLDLSPHEFHSAVAGLAAPWGWALPHAVPSLELVEATRYWRGQHGGFPAWSGTWWTFVLTAVVVYGLLPRLAAWTFAQVKLRRALARLPLDTPDVERVVRRLTAPVIQTGGGASAAPAALADAALPSATKTAGETYAVVTWRDFPAQAARVDRALAEHFGGLPGARFTAGRVEFEAEANTLEALAAAKPARVLVLAESWEAPDKALLRFLRALRAAVGTRAPVVVGLAEVRDDAWLTPGREAMLVWKEKLLTLEDPWLAVEPLPVAP